MTIKSSLCGLIPSFPDLRSCVKVEVAVLGSPSLIVRTVSADYVKQHWTRTSLFSASDLTNGGERTGRRPRRPRLFHFLVVVLAAVAGSELPVFLVSGVRRRQRCEKTETAKEPQDQRLETSILVKAQRDYGRKAPAAMNSQNNN